MADPEIWTNFPVSFASGSALCVCYMCVFVLWTFYRRDKQAASPEEGGSGRAVTNHDTDNDAMVRMKAA